MRTHPLLGLLVLVCAAGSPVGAQSPSTDLSSYALFAFTELRNRALVVTDGNLGVNAGGGSIYSAFGLHAPLSDVVAARVRIPESECRTLFANVAPLKRCGQPALFTSPFASPAAVTEACGFPARFPSCGGADVTVAPGEVVRLQAGTYNHIAVNGGVLPGRVVMLGGDYTFCTLRVSRNADLLFDSAAQVFIDGDLDLGGMDFTGSGGGDIGAPDVRFLVRGSSVRFRPRSRVFGRLCAPNAKLRVAWGSKLFGSFVAQTIRTDRITVRAIPAGTPGTTTTTTTATTSSSTTSTASTTTSTTTTTAPAPRCGDGRLDPGESCEPPGAAVCPSPGGAFLTCDDDCGCPRAVDIRCCLPPSTEFLRCELLKPAECAQQGGINIGLGACEPDPCASVPTTTTTTTGPATTTTTSSGPATSTTTTTGGSATTTSTTPTGPTPRGEICGNCLDDDDNGLTDFEDQACCAGVQRFEMVLRGGRIRPRGATSAVKLASSLARAGLAGIDPLREDVFVQIRAESKGELLCARVPATRFTRKHGTFRFWNRGQVPSAMGLDDLSVKVRRNGTVNFRTRGRRVQLSGATAGGLRITVGFRDPAAVDGANRCSATVQNFRTAGTGALLAP